jgi:hypothetical protein
MIRRIRTQKNNVERTHLGANPLTPAASKEKTVFSEQERNHENANFRDSV